MAKADSGAPGDNGIMSWAAIPGTYMYAVRIRPAGDKGAGAYRNIKPTADDTSDGTMDIPIGKYVAGPGLYEFQHRATLEGGGWTPYSAFQTVAYGTSTAPPPALNDPAPAEPAPSHPAPTADGIMSWAAIPGTYMYAVRIRPAGDKGAGAYRNIKPTADDTSDGTMDIPIGKYVDAPGLYEFQHRATLEGGGWTPYSAFQTVAYGDVGGNPTGPAPAPDNPAPAEPEPQNPAPSHPAPTADGIMSWTAIPGTYMYAVRIRPAGDKGAGAYRNIKPTADDTSDGTMDIPIGKYVDAPGLYEFQHRATLEGGGWTPYSAFQTVAYGTSAPLTLMVVGDSFSIASRGLPKHLETTLDGLGYDVQVIDFAKSGDTAAMALARLESYLAKPGSQLPDMALIALGTNDAVQKIAPGTTKAKLDAIIDLFDARDVEVLLGQPAAVYPHRVSGAKGFTTTAEQKAFHQLYAELAAEQDGVILSRDFHAGLERTSNLESDGFHPNQAGTQLMAANLADELSLLLQDHLADQPVA